MTQRLSVQTHRTKDCPAFIKAWDEEQGILEGYASVGGFPDSYGDIVEPGAFKKTLKEFKGRIRLCWQHNFREPIGKPYVLKEHDASKLPPELLERFPDATCGLYFESHISDTTQGRDAKALLRDGVVDEMSIGYDVYPEGENLDEKGFHHLTDIILYEISPVTMAAMPAAMITDYKALELKAAIPYKETPKAPEGEAWDGPSETAAAEVGDLKIMCAWVDSENSDLKTAYKLPHHKASGHAVVWRAVMAAGNAFMGARGGVNIPASDEAGVKAHLAKHYAEFDKTPPWEKQAEGGTMPGVAFLGSDGVGAKIGRVISQKNEDKLRQAADLITEVLSFLDEDTEAKEQATPGEPGSDPKPALGQGESLALRIRVRQAEL